MVEQGKGLWRHGWKMETKWIFVLRLPCASVEAFLQKPDSCKNWHQLSSGGASLEVNMGGLPRSTVQSSWLLHNSHFLSQFVWCAFEGVIRHVIKRIQKTIEEAFTIISFSNNVNDILLLQYLFVAGNFDICQTQSGKLNGCNLVSGAGH